MTPGMGEGVEGGLHRAAMSTAMGARGELCLGRERGRRGLGQVEEGAGVLTVEAIGLRWAHVGDRWGDTSSVQEQRR